VSPDLGLDETYGVVTCASDGPGEIEPTSEIAGTCTDL
jgi:hypothetical protein